MILHCSCPIFQAIAILYRYDERPFFCQIAFALLQKINIRVPAFCEFSCIFQNANQRNILELLRKLHIIQVSNLYVEILMLMIATGSNRGSTFRKLYALDFFNFVQKGPRHPAAAGTDFQKRGIVLERIPLQEIPAHRRQVIEYCPTIIVPQDFLYRFFTAHKMKKVLFYIAVTIYILSPIPRQIQSSEILLFRNHSSVSSLLDAAIRASTNHQYHQPRSGNFFGSSL